jgi:hypothetical protein
MKASITLLHVISNCLIAPLDLFSAHGNRLNKEKQHFGIPHELYLAKKRNEQVNCVSSLHVCTACNWAAVRMLELSSHMAVFNRLHSDHDTLNQWRVNKASPVVSSTTARPPRSVHLPLIGECHLLQITCSPNRHIS